MFSNNGTEKSLQNSLFLKNFLTRYFFNEEKNIYWEFILKIAISSD